MDNEKRITLKEAAKLVGLSGRTLLRWRADGLITVHYPPHLPDGSTAPATYDREEVLRAARMQDVQLPETD